MNIDYELTKKIKEKTGNKFDRFLTILLLIEYRTYCPGTFSIFGDESSFFKNAFRLVFYLPVKLLWLFIRKNRNDGCVLLSNNFWQNSRYAQLLLEATKKYNLIGFFDINIIDSMFKNDFFSWFKILKFRNIGVSINKIFDLKLRNSVIEVYKFFDSYKRSESIEYDKLLNSIEKMDSILSDRIEKIKKILSSNRISSFITINQFNLFDQLIIISCNELKVITKNLNHYIEFTDNAIMKFTGCKYHLYWCEEDVNKIKRFNKYIYNLSPKDIISVGCPEITFSILRKFQADIVGKFITFFVPDSTYMYLWGKCTRDDILKSSSHFITLVIKMWSELFNSIYQLSLKYGYKVFVKYHPGENTKCLNISKEFEKKYGFVRSNNYQNSLYKICSKSTFCFGYNTSALYIAKVFGSICFNIKLNDTMFSDLSSYGIHTVNINEIRNLDLNSFTKKVVKNLCFDFDKTFNYIV